MAISDKIRQQICAAANYRCEYCKTSSKLTGMPLVMERRLLRNLLMDVGS